MVLVVFSGHVFPQCWDVDNFSVWGLWERAVFALGAGCESGLFVIVLSDLCHVVLKQVVSVLSGIALIF